MTEIRKYRPGPVHAAGCTREAEAVNGAVATLPARLCTSCRGSQLGFKLWRRCTLKIK